MFLYRRKVLLALIEVCGGKLDSTDLEKLLFLYCERSGRRPYDFFPYRFGCFSFVSYQDKRWLTAHGYLSDCDGFNLRLKSSHLDALDVLDRSKLVDFAKELKHIRGRKLVRHVYQKFPYYAIRSEIKEEVLSPTELAKVEASAPKEYNHCLFTLGYEGITIDAYIDKLIKNNVSLVVDVRRNPISMKYGFSKTRLKDYLSKAGIGYEHIPELGIESSLRKGLEGKEDYRILFDKYEKEMLPHKTVEMERLKELAMKHNRLALTCFEAEYSSCHRHKITERLQTDSSFCPPIVHI